MSDEETQREPDPQPEPEPFEMPVIKDPPPSVEPPVAAAELAEGDDDDIRIKIGDPPPRRPPK
jgi:hypothetical protein